MRSYLPLLLGMCVCVVIHFLLCSVSVWFTMHVCKVLLGVALKSCKYGYFEVIRIGACQ